MGDACWTRRVLGVCLLGGRVLTTRGGVFAAWDFCWRWPSEQTLRPSLAICKNILWWFAKPLPVAALACTDNARAWRGKARQAAASHSLRSARAAARPWRPVRFCLPAAPP